MEKYRVELIQGTAEDMRSSMEAALNEPVIGDPVEYVHLPQWGAVLVVFKQPRARARKGDN